MQFYLHLFSFYLTIFLYNACCFSLFVAWFFYDFFFLILCYVIEIGIAWLFFSLTRLRLAFFFLIEEIRCWTRKDEYKYTFSILVTCLSLDRGKKRFIRRALLDALWRARVLLDELTDERRLMELHFAALRITLTAHQRVTLMAVA